MFQNFGSFWGGQPPQQDEPTVAEPVPDAASLKVNSKGRKPTFTKIFRWRLPDGQTRAPAAVEIVGTFTGWQKVPLIPDGMLGAWQVTIPQIQSNRTHHYMLLVDGKPVYDKDCDGVAVPRRLAGTAVPVDDRQGTAFAHALRANEVSAVTRSVGRRIAGKSVAPGEKHAFLLRFRDPLPAHHHAVTAQQRTYSVGGVTV